MVFVIAGMLNFIISVDLIGCFILLLLLFLLGLNSVGRY